MQSKQDKEIYVHGRLTNEGLSIEGFYQFLQAVRRIFISSLIS